MGEALFKSLIESLQQNTRQITIALATRGSSFLGEAD